MDALAKAEAVQGWMRPRELSFLFGAALSIPRDGLVVEVGSWKGRSTIAIAEGLDARADFVAVDTFEGEPLNAGQMHKFRDELGQDKIFAEFRTNTAAYDRLRVIRDTSVAASSQFRDESVDWIFIDAEHTTERVIEDIRAWFPKLKLGGLISGHDYLHLDVRLGVASYFGSVSHWETIWFTRKKSQNLHARPVPRLLAAARTKLRETPAVEKPLRAAWARARRLASH